MGYDHIRLSEDANDLCDIFLPLRKYKYKRLPIGVCNSLDISQAKMNEMFCGFGFI